MKTNQQLDYHCGWRWLLPLRDPDQIALIGFSDSEIAFWQQALSGIALTDDTATATVWLIQDLSLGDLANFDAPHLHTVCIIGSRSVVTTWRNALAERFETIHDYALLPPHNPRVVIPLGTSDWTTQALALHRPGRRLARLAVFLLKTLARIGFDRPLRSRTLCIASQATNAWPQGARLAGLDRNRIDAPQDFALYLGSPNDHRKTVILPLGGIRQTILKCGESPQAHAALRHEVAALQTLSQTLLAPQVPVLLDVVERDNQLALHQEYRARQAVNRARLEQAAVAFLSELSRLERHHRPLAEVLQRGNILTSDAARAVGQIAYAAVRERLDTIADAGATVWGHRSHGDFAPWNCAWTAQGFFVFDWEESRTWDVALGDAFYFVVAPAVHIARSPNPQAVEARAWVLVGAVAKAAGLPVGELRMNWALWLLQRMSQQPAPLYERLLERQAKNLLIYRPTDIKGNS
ncbi:MAG: hypothetical protein P9E24_07585 [Candidatus Competibacter sp.]|nr:hypothetical protein [Candidatus Competibacter sp.]MDG4584722.1 hypothetical protein [Candidatus Competibacter sp.]